MLKESGNLTKEAVVADVGAGTGLLLKRLSEEAKEVIALEISPDFRLYLQERVQRDNLLNVTVRESTAVGLDLTPESTDLAVMVDVYHHLEYPRTCCAAIRASLKQVCIHISILTCT
jgi:16S rRNA A1518/A1519 N6-dimethyltransferase RsmA/KsgA/DIM1 with predicted DNA glycosylase/AP lyase activity